MCAPFGYAGLITLFGHYISPFLMYYKEYLVVINFDCKLKLLRLVSIIIMSFSGCSISNEVELFQHLHSSDQAG